MCVCLCLICARTTRILVHHFDITLPILQYTSSWVRVNPERTGGEGGVQLIYANNNMCGLLWLCFIAVLSFWLLVVYLEYINVVLCYAHPQ